MSTTTAQITARETANAARKIVRKLPVKTSSGIQFTGLWIRKTHMNEVLMSYQTKSYKHMEDAMAIQLPLVIEELKANGFTIEYCGYGDYTVSK
jgi:hypothetical protein